MNIETKTYTLKLEEYEGREAANASFNHVLRSVYIGPVKAALLKDSVLFTPSANHFKTVVEDEVRD